MIIFDASDECGSGARDDGFNVRRICIDPKQGSMSVPTLSFLRDSFEFASHVFGVNHTLNHEFGHTIFSLLGLDPLFGKSTKNIRLELLDLEKYEFSKKLFFPSVPIEIAKKFVGEGGNESLYPYMVVNLMWHNSAEILQEIGVKAAQDMVVINLLSDLDLSIERKMPILWSHIGDPEHFQEYLQELPHTVTEEDIAPLFYLRGIDYSLYKQRLLETL